ncbi:MAG: hypothetical protein WC285_04065 [Candidatus Gracilibacteria bacterium]|jgi:hypothetical protein
MKASRTFLSLVVLAAFAACNTQYDGAADGGTDNLNPGQNGQNGNDGIDGVDGEPGEPGANGVDGEDGEDGRDGENGQDGDNGTDGEDGDCTCPPTSSDGGGVVTGDDGGVCTCTCPDGGSGTTNDDGGDTTDILGVVTFRSNREGTSVQTVQVLQPGLNPATRDPRPEVSYQLSAEEPVEVALRYGTVVVVRLVGDCGGTAGTYECPTLALEMEPGLSLRGFTPFTGESLLDSPPGNSALGERIGSSADPFVQTTHWWFSP